MSKMKDYIIDQHNKELKQRIKPILKKEDFWEYQYNEMDKYNFNIWHNQYAVNKEETREIAVHKKGWEYMYSLFHPTLTECRIQLEMMVNNPHLIE